MASSTSSDLKLELITTGEKSGTWGSITNTNLQILEQAASGYLSLAVGSGDVALALTNFSTSNGKNLYYKLTGTLTANRTVTMPDSAERVFISSGPITKGYHTATAAYTAVAGDQIFANTTSSAFTITLPASPAVGDEVTFIDARGTFNSNNLTIDRNSQPINSGTSNLVLSTNGQAITLVYVDATRGWAFKTNTA